MIPASYLFKDVFQQSQRPRDIATAARAGIYSPGCAGSRWMRVPAQRAQTSTDKA